MLFSVVFWFPLWTGGGLVGSDIYAYFLPQKAFYAQRLGDGELPLWNNLIGFGYPQVAESQTGVFYPPNLALYPLLDLNSAFSASIILHYVLAFVFAAMYARRIGLPRLASGLAALVFTYAWFPPRVCLEWAIIGGAWLPLALWCAESYLQTRFWRYGLLLTATLAMQMLAGHFTLAFITQLTLAGYVPLRLWLCSADVAATTRKSRVALCGALALAVIGAFFLAAVQLLPSWELKRHSQRQTVTDEHDPGYGSIPARYLSQIIVPWEWYPQESSFDDAIAPGGSRTNRVEAHLYFGLMPLAFMLWGAWQQRQRPDRRLVAWMIVGLAALIYTTGCLLPVSKHLPGFSFFEGPGRYGVVTTLVAGLLAGAGFADLCQRAPAVARWLLASVAPSAARRFSAWMGIAAQAVLTIVVFAGTTADLFIVSRLVTFAYFVTDPPIDHLAESPLRRLLADAPQPVRIFSEGKNLPSLLGVATVPTYLGLGPSQYFDPEFALPQPFPYSTSPTEEQLDWFHRGGVTHYLSFAPIDWRAWSARLVWEGPDLFLNRALNRQTSALFYLYDLEGGRGRVAFSQPQSGQSAHITEYRANRVEIEADSRAGGRLILTDLAFPDWKVAVDRQNGEPLTVEGMFRGVDLPAGKHTVVWTYRPLSLYWGAGISLAALVIFLAVSHVRYWHPMHDRR